MSEESERVGSGPEGNGVGVDPTAVALALAGASRERADAFLADQRKPIEGARAFTGTRDDAKARFARAARLDLASSEKVELAGMNHG